MKYLKFDELEKIQLSPFTAQVAELWKTSDRGFYPIAFDEAYNKAYEPAERLPHMQRLTWQALNEYSFVLFNEVISWIISERVKIDEDSFFKIFFTSYGAGLPLDTYSEYMERIKKAFEK